MNQVILHGRVSQDIDTKTTQDNRTIAKFGIAVRNDFKNANGEYDTQFFNCVAFGKSAEHISQFYNKGKEILIIGRLQNSSWETENGEKRYRTDIVVNSTEFCGTKGDSQSTTQENKDSIINVVEGPVDDDLPF